MIKVDEEAISANEFHGQFLLEKKRVSTGSKTDGGSPLRSDVAFSITKGPLMILEEWKKKKKKKSKRGNGLGSEIFLEESRYHLNQVASISYCTCHLWQRWHRFLLCPGNLHHPLLGSLRIIHLFFLFALKFLFLSKHDSLHSNSPVLYSDFCREFPPRKAYNN